MSRGARAICWTANGYANCTAMACWRGRFAQRRKCCHCERHRRLRPQQDRHEQRAPRDVLPRPAEPAPSLRLMIGDDRRAFRVVLVEQALCRRALLDEAIRLSEPAAQQWQHRVRAEILPHDANCAALTRWAARGCVLSRAASTTSGAPCVLASHSPIAPGSTSRIVRQDLARTPRLD